ncbi:MAG: dihydropteroate synthase [Halieaceae bacterium]|nr:dihydropteroate synthase [Halieaceae bacterium]
MVNAITCGARILDLSRPRIMGVLNVTPDSFSDGGQLYRDGRVHTDALLVRAEKMLAEGADILDVGGESTRPGAAAVSEAEELDRVVTAVEALARHCDTIISVDTSTPSVMRESARCGAGLLNDVRGFQRPQALQAAADTGLALCVMHMQGEPDTMQTGPTYSHVVQDIAEFLGHRLADVSAAGIDLDRVIIDPGFGFGKTAEQNFELLARLEVLCNQSQPVLVGLSRKSMISSVLDRLPEQRMVASVALALMAVERGARIVRVHDVAATFDAVSMWQTTRHALSQSQPI